MFSFKSGPTMAHSIDTGAISVTIGHLTFGRSNRTFSPFPVGFTTATSLQVLTVSITKDGTNVWMEPENNKMKYNKSEPSAVNGNNWLDRVNVNLLSAQSCPMKPGKHWHLPKWQWPLLLQLFVHDTLSLWMTDMFNTTDTEWSKSFKMVIYHEPCSSSCLVCICISCDSLIVRRWMAPLDDDNISSLITWNTWCRPNDGGSFRLANNTKRACKGA